MHSIEPGKFSRRIDGQEPGTPGFDSLQGQDFFVCSVRFRPDLGPTRPPMQWVRG
jgi:hypothetical protein